MRQIRGIFARLIDSPWLGRGIVAGLIAATLLRALWVWPQTLAWDLVLPTCVVFGACWCSAERLLGATSAKWLLLLSLTLGGAAEQIGVLTGQPFGPFRYTEVLGPWLGLVPMVVPMMWFALCFAAGVVAQLVLRRRPLALRHDPPGWPILLAAALVTAFDLGAKTYFVHLRKAWIEEDGNGTAWFGLGHQGFIGWAGTAAVILGVHALVAKPPHGQPRIASLPAVWPVYVPLGLYLGALLFFSIKGGPSEARIAVTFAMGLPLLCAFAGLQHWHHAQLGRVAGHRESKLPAPIDPKRLDDVLMRQRRIGDPLADQLLVEIARHGGGLVQLRGLFARWGNNAKLRGWLDEHLAADGAQAASDPAAPGLNSAQAVERLVARFARDALRMPGWLDPAEVQRAQSVFFSYGPLPSAVLFCASLPQTYVVPDIASRLHRTGQLLHRTRDRVRRTAWMVFAVMKVGGLVNDDESGLAAVFKVRLVHAMVRHLAGNAVGQAHAQAPADAVLNQVDQAYTLLCFSLVLLLGFKRLHVGLSGKDERAMLHAWNVVGHLLGMGPELMAFTMTEAELVFKRQHQSALQCRQTASDTSQASNTSDVCGPALTRALLDFMAEAIPIGLLKHMPVLLMWRLCGMRTSRALRLHHQPVSWLVRLLFALTMGLARALDAVGRCFSPGFALCRLLAQALGYRIVTEGLSAYGLPAEMPELASPPGRTGRTAVLPQVASAAEVRSLLDDHVQGWQSVRPGPRWQRHLQDRLSGAEPP